MKSKSCRAPRQGAGWIVMTRRLGCVFVAVMATGCQSSVSTPTTPTTPLITFGGPPVPTGPFTISGAVTEGAHPVVGANVNAFISTNGFGYSYMWAHGAVLTDVAGQFRMTGLPTDAGVWFNAWKDGYVQRALLPR